MKRLSPVFVLGVLLCLAGCQASRSSVPVLAKYQGLINPMAEFYLNDQLKPVSPCPVQGIITTQEEYSRFVGRIPSMVPFSTKGNDHPNDDPLLKKPPVDFAKQMIIVVVRKESMYLAPDIVSVVPSGDSLLVKCVMPDLKEFDGYQENGMGTYCAVVVPKTDIQVRFDKKIQNTTQPSTQGDGLKPAP